MPEWSRGSALALLGPEDKAWIARFDRQCCADNATEWKLHHAWLQRVRARAEALQAGMAQASAADLVEFCPIAQTPGSPRRRAPAVRTGAGTQFRTPQVPCGAWAQALPEGDREARLACLHRLWDVGSNDRWWAARTALAEPETPDGL